MTLSMCRRELLAAGALAGTATMLPSGSHSYDYYDVRVMRSPPLEEGEFVWQWLLLLIDASASMRQPFERMTFYDLQIEATARSLLEPCVADRLIGSRLARNAIGVILWSATMQQEIAVHWKVIRTREDISAIAVRLRRTANYLDSYTGVTAAVRFAMGQFGADYVADGSRKVIDVTANGRDNQGGDPSVASSEAERLGITINAVVMEGYDGSADEIYEYYENRVITKDGLIFKVRKEGEGLETLARASTSKLCSEIALAPHHLHQPA
jgi:Ca-activated chloride channel homolog